MPSLYSPWPLTPRFSALTWVRKCMRVAFHQMKNGLSVGVTSSRYSRVRAVTSSSIVSMRFCVSGPVSSIFCVPSACAQLWMTPRGPKRFLKAGSFG